MAFTRTELEHSHPSTPPSRNMLGDRARSSSEPPQMKCSACIAKEYRRSSAESCNQSYADSAFPYETPASSVGSLPTLQQKTIKDSDCFSPLQEDDPSSFDLISPKENLGDMRLGLEKKAELLFSHDHLTEIFADPKLLFKFTSFLSSARPKSMLLVQYYLDSLKAIKAVNYANAVYKALEPRSSHKYTESSPQPTLKAILEENMNHAFDAMLRDDLPAYVASTYVQVVSVSIQQRITGTMAPRLRDASEGLAEVFCLTDPSRTDNPIIFASEGE